MRHRSLIRSLCRALPGRTASKTGAALLRAAFVVTLLCGVAGTAGESFAQSQNTLEKLSMPRMDSNEPMLLQADEMIYDNDQNRVTAQGNVEIYYGNYTLLADKVVYDRNVNTLNAEGNVRIRDPQGAVITADYITLTDDFRDGFIESLRLVTSDDTRIVAERATRRSGDVTDFDSAWFTPCKPCEENPDKPPTWRIRSTKVIHNQTDATITYENAYFDFLGTPIMYVPWFRHADPTVKRRSGFLMPTYSHDSTLGNTVTVPYYFALSPHYDFTFAPLITENAGTVLQGFWRHRMRNGGYRLDLAGVWDDDNPGAHSRFRGSVRTVGRFSLNPYWAWGWTGDFETDDTFRRFYNFDSKFKKDRVSQLYLEGLRDRNYFAARLYDLKGEFRESVDETIADSSTLPTVDYNYIFGAPVLGGELSFDTYATNLIREDGPRSQQLVGELNWRRQMIDRIGQVFTPFANVRGAAYDVSNVENPLSAPIQGEDGSYALGNAAAGIEYRYPFVSYTSRAAHVFEPIAQVIARPNSIGDQERIPNEDAQSLVFDDTILFDIDKFSGYNRMETGTRANVGVRYTAQLYSGGYARAVFGESFQLAGENPYALDTGLGTSRSDYVAGLYLEARGNFGFVAQTRYDSETWDWRATNVGSWFKYGLLNGNVGYAKSNPMPTIDLRDPREEIRANGSLALTDDWSLLGLVRYDLELDQSITQGIGLQYQDDCFTFALTYRENFIRDRDIEPDQIVQVRFALKYLGEYQFSTDPFGDLGSQLRD